MENGFEMKKFKEENPFEDERVAKEWINSVENEKDMYRDVEIYPRLKNWLKQHDTELVIEIGSGQGICSDNLGDFRGRYIGIEPSEILTERARELYKDEKKDFVVGDAYHIPIESGKAEAGFSVMVWLHLENLNKASSELARILKPEGRFMIITANPNAEKTWESFYFDHEKNGKKIIGKVNVPVNSMSKSIYYQHTKDEILSALKNNGFEVGRISDFGPVNGENIFISIEGRKKDLKF